MRRNRHLAGQRSRVQKRRCGVVYLVPCDETGKKSCPGSQNTGTADGVVVADGSSRRVMGLDLAEEAAVVRGSNNRRWRREDGAKRSLGDGEWFLGVCLRDR